MTEQNSFPVRAIAGVTLNNFIGYEATSELYRRTLEDLLKTILDLLDMFFTEGLIDTLKDLIGEYDEEIIPFAVDLCSKLGDTYVEIMQSIDFTDEENNDPKQIQTAQGCVNAINSLL
jgi:importin-7